jgi:hypothetical protein
MPATHISVPATPKPISAMLSNHVLVIYMHGGDIFQEDLQNLVLELEIPEEFVVQPTDPPRKQHPLSLREYFTTHSTPQYADSRVYRKYFHTSEFYPDDDMHICLLVTYGPQDPTSRIPCKAQEVFTSTLEAKI